MQAEERTGSHEVGYGVNCHSETSCASEAAWGWVRCRCLASTLGAGLNGSGPKNGTSNNSRLLPNTLSVSWPEPMVPGLHVKGLRQY